MTKPWVRLYRREEGSFAQLSLYARALAAELLKLTDDAGVIRIGSKAPHEAIAFALGATRSDRRLLKIHVGELLADGYLVHEGATLRVPGFPRFQRVEDEVQSVPAVELPSGPPASEEDVHADPCAEDDEESVEPPQSDHDGATKRPRRSNEATATEQRSDHDGATKDHVTTRNHTRALRAEQSREDQSRADARRCARDPAKVDPLPPDPSVQIVERYRREWAERKGSVAPRTDWSDRKITDLVVLLREQAKLDGCGVEDVLERFFTRFWASERAAELGHAPGAMRALFGELMSREWSPTANRGRRLQAAPARPHEEFTATSDEEFRRMCETPTGVGGV